MSAVEVDAVDLVCGAIEAAELLDPRALQTESGASNTFECRAATHLRLTGVEKSNPRVSLAAIFGKAMHSYLETVVPAFVPQAIAERKFSYKGTPATLDLLLPAAESSWALWDYKCPTKDKLQTIKKDGPTRKQRGQIHLGAAAAIDAGYEVKKVGLIFVPRDSNSLDDIWSWSEPFSRELADEAAQFHQEQRDLGKAVKATRLRSEIPDLDGMRDEPMTWCESFCEWVDVCRGPERAQTPEDPALIDLAQRYMVAKLEADEAYARVRYYKEQLEQAPPMIVDGFKLAWSGGNPKTETVVDVDELKAAFEMFVGPVPTVTVETRTARSFRMTKARVKS